MHVGQTTLADVSVEVTADVLLAAGEERQGSDAVLALGGLLGCGAEDAVAVGAGQVQPPAATCEYKCM